MGSCLVLLVLGVFRLPCGTTNLGGSSRTVPGDRGAAWTCFWPYRATCHTAACAPRRPCLDLHGAACSRDLRLLLWRCASLQTKFLNTKPFHLFWEASGLLEVGGRRWGEMHSAVRSCAPLCSADHETRPVRPALASRNRRGRKSAAVVLLLFLGLARQSAAFTRKIPLYPPCIKGYHIPTPGGNCTACAQGKFGLGDYT